MKSFRAIPRRSASALIYALIVIAVGAVVLAGWIYLMGARTLFTEQMSLAVKRRLVLENSRQMVSSYLLENVLPGSHAAGFTADLGNTWGAFTIDGPAVSEGPWQPLESEAVSEAANVFSPCGSGGYTVDFSAALSDGNATQQWLFQARSRSPLFAFDLFHSLKPTENPSTQIIVQAGLRVDQGAVLWAPNAPNSYALTVGSYRTPTVGLPSASLLDGGGANVLLSNFAFLPVTSGAAGTGLGYDGAVSVVSPAVVGAVNSLSQRVLGSPHVYVDPNVENTDETLDGVTCDGAGNVTIDLLEPGVSRIYIAGGVSTLTLQGQSSAPDLVTADDRPGLLIVVVQDASALRDLTSIQLEGQNNRRLYLAVKKNTGTAVAVTSASPSPQVGWRFGGIFENTPVNFSVTGDVLQLQGGLRSDQPVGIAGGFVDIVRETDPKLLERHADRIAWLESFQE